MNIYHGIEDFKKLDFAVVTSGTFDGVHLGHQKILSRLKEIAKKYNGETVLLTYWPHPKLVLYPERIDLQLLNTFEEKAELLRQEGIDHLIRIPFTKSFAQTSSETFIKKILVNTIGTKKLVIGYDHRFGKNREGSFEHLKANAEAYGFDVEEISRQEVDDVGISSTKIRGALKAGDVSLASGLLGRPYTIQGRVVKGERIGRMIGFPTANIEIEFKHKLVPANGAYSVIVKYNDTTYKGMLNIGYRPTVGGASQTIEVNLFDFDKEMYGEQLAINFIDRLRNEKDFGDVEQLKSQLARDKSIAQQQLKNI